MKIFSAVSALLFSAAGVLPLVSSQPFYDVNIPTPVCARFDTITFQGDAEFVTTEDTSTFPIGAGDMSIGERYDAISGVPNQGTLWTNIGVDYKSICVITKEQPLMGGTGATSPTCFYEFEMEFCRRWWWILFESPYLQLEKKFEVKLMKPSELDISEARLIEVASELSKDPNAPDVTRQRRRTQRTYEKIDDIYIAPSIIAPSIIAPFSTIAPFPSPPSPTPAPTPSTGGRCEDKLIKAVQFSDEFAEATKSTELKRALCPNKFCWIPLYRDCRCGGFTAHGSGPDHLEITGGTYDLFGAFGQIVTPNDFQTGAINYSTGDLTGSSIDMNIEICYYRKEVFPRIFNGV